MMCLAYNVSYDSISLQEHDVSVLTLLATPGAGLQDTKQRFACCAGKITQTPHLSRSCPRAGNPSLKFVSSVKTLIFMAHISSFMSPACLGKPLMIEISTYISIQM